MSGIGGGALGTLGDLEAELSELVGETVARFLVRSTFNLRDASSKVTQVDLDLLSAKIHDFFGPSADLICELLAVDVVKSAVRSK